MTLEFGPSTTQVRYTTCALFVGLCIGAVFWGVISDVVGRRLAFNATLFIAGVFGLAIGGGPSWVATWYVTINPVHFHLRSRRCLEREEINVKWNQ